MRGTRFGFSVTSLIARCRFTLLALPISASSTLSTSFALLALTLFQVGCLSGTQSTTASIDQTQLSSTASGSGAGGSSTLRGLTISVNSGNQQIGSVGAPLPSLLIVSVKDSSGNLAPNIQLNWTVTSGGGSVSSSTSITNSNGISSNLFILGTTPGKNTVSATINGQTSSTNTTAPFTATSSAGAPTQISISTGNNQSSTVGSSLNSALGVQVSDSYGNVLSGVSVNWTVVSGGGSLSNATSTTNSNGVASTALTLGTVSGTNLVAATINGTSGSALFTETAVARTPTSLSVSSGNNQTGNAASVLGVPFSVIALDSNGNAVPGVTVNWVVTGGGGSLSSASNLTTATGISSTTLTLGNAPGTNTVTASIATPALTTTFTATATLTASFQGWNNIQALGGRTPVAQSGLATTTPTVTLGWNAMTSTSETISSYNIYRATASGGQNFTSPLATGISTTALTYTDATPIANTTYYYVVRPVIAGTAYPTTDVDTEIKIMVPPTNMSLVHRWMANYEMCTNLMGRSIDRTHNYRCPYVGPISVGGFYDFGIHEFWDTVGVGCNYTPPNATASLSCGDSTNGCLGVVSGPPSISATTYDGQIFYDRGGTSFGNRCYIASSGAWVTANNSNSAQLALMVSHQPGLPLLVNITQTQSQLACQQLIIPGIGTEGLPKHSEQVIASAWPISMSDATISAVENGTSLSSTGYCNSNSGSGLTYDNNATPTNLETLPGTLASGTFLVRSGSTSTQNCVSLYGIQDLVGNVWEWSSDQITTCSSSTHICSNTAVTPIDSANIDWFGGSPSLTLNFDGISGPGGMTETQWALSSESNNATDFLPALGVPLVGGVSSNFDAMSIGTGTGQFNPTKFHSNNFWILTDTASGYPRGPRAGGGYTSSGTGGRFGLYLENIPTTVASNQGLRCRIGAGN